MKPKIADDVPQADWDLFLQIREIIEALPRLLESPGFVFGVFLPKTQAITHFIPDCHTMTRALAKFLPVEVHDGLIVEQRGEDVKRHWHSWLTRKDGDGKIIIDPWPLGVVSGPALFIQDYAFHFGPDQAPSAQYLGHQQFKRHLAITRFEIRKILRKQKQDLKAAA